MNYLQNLKESDERILDNYDEVDFHEVFMKSFRIWLSKNVDFEELDTPLSYLLRTYGDKFVLELLGPSQLSNSTFSKEKYSIRSLVSSYGKKLVIKGLEKLPTMRKNQFFMDSYGKYLKTFIKKLNLPDWINISLNEVDPFDLDIILNYNYDGLLKLPYNSSDVKENLDLIERKIEEFIGDVLGLEKGNPVHGKIAWEFFRETDRDEWVKKVLNGSIKKDIKNIEGSNNVVHSIRFDARKSGADMKIVTKSSARWKNINEFNEKVREYLKNKGYKRITVVN